MRSPVLRLMASIHAASGVDRDRLVELIAETHGKLYARLLREYVEADELLANNEAQAKAASRSHRSKKAAATRRRQRGGRS